MAVLSNDCSQMSAPNPVSSSDGRLASLVNLTLFPASGEQPSCGSLFPNDSLLWLAFHWRRAVLPDSNCWWRDVGCSIVIYPPEIRFGRMMVTFASTRFFVSETSSVSVPRRRGTFLADILNDTS